MRLFAALLLVATVAATVPRATTLDQIRVLTFRQVPPAAKPYADNFLISFLLLLFLVVVGRIHRCTTRARRAGARVRRRLPSGCDAASSAVPEPGIRWKRLSSQCIPLFEALLRVF